MRCFIALMKERRVPALRIVPPYYDHPAYLDAMTALVRDEQAKLPWEPEHYLVSFHGLPIRYSQAGDPYATHVKRTTAALVARLGWPRRGGRNVSVAFRTRRVAEALHREHSGETGEEWRAARFRGPPGFTADCLETLDEIGHEAHETFVHAGGEKLHACPCLNEHPAWIEAMRTLVLEEGRGWIG